MVLLVILGLLKFVQNSLIEPVKTCYYCPIIISPASKWRADAQHIHIRRGRCETHTTDESGLDTVQLTDRPTKDWANYYLAIITRFKRFDRRILDEFQEAQDDQ